MLILFGIWDAKDCAVVGEGDFSERFAFFDAGAVMFAAFGQGQALALQTEFRGLMVAATQMIEQLGNLLEALEFIGRMRVRVGEIGEVQETA